MGSYLFDRLDYVILTAKQLLTSLLIDRLTGTKRTSGKKLT